MLEFIRDASTLQFFAGIIAFICLVMIILQASIRKSVWGWYLILFFASVITIVATLR